MKRIVWFLGVVWSGMVLASSANGRWIAFPFLYYTPETGVSAGATGIYLTLFDMPASGERVKSELEPSFAGRTSSAQASLVVTERNQWIASFGPDAYYDGGRKALLSHFSLRYFPDRFYSLGPDSAVTSKEDYTSRISRARLVHLWSLEGPWYLGGGFHYERHEVLNKPAGGQLDAGNIAGADGIGIFGGGMEVHRDSRDRQFEAHTGAYTLFRAFLYGASAPLVGPFASFHLEQRQFVPVGEGKVIATQIVAQQRTEHPPFQFLSQIGGSTLLRGYYQGRFRDRALFVAQAEYRAPLFWRLRGAVFGGGGSVGPDLWSAASGSWVAAGGAGIRFVLDRDSGMNARLDVAYGREGTSFYFMMGEAF